MDLTTEPLRRALVRLALPIMGAMLLETLFNLLNAFWVGRLGTLAFAGVNLSSFSVWLMFALVGVVTTGTNSVVAQRLGAGDREQARRAAHVGIVCAFCLGVLMAAPVVLWGEDLLRLMAGEGRDAEAAVKIGTGYLSLLFLWAPVHCLNETFSAIFRAAGDTRTPLRAYSVGFLLNFALDPLLIYGPGPFPRLEVMGAALATNLSFTVVLCLYLTMLGKLPFRLGRARGESLRQVLSRHWLNEIVRIGTPPCVAMVTFCLVYMFLAPIVGTFGAPALAALGIGHRVESLSYLICHGFSLATVTLVGQNMGAGLEERARKAAWVAVGVVSGATVGTGLLYFFGAPVLARLFSRDPAVLAIAVPYLQAMAFSQLPMGVYLVLQGAFAGAGRTLPPTLVSIATVVCRVPLSDHLALTLGLGIRAIWWSLVGLTCLQGAVTVLLFALGLWRRKAPAVKETPPNPYPPGGSQNP
ncbi:MAG: MATE family efflux transporter [Candidatus Eremiobacterota bacterium]